MYAIIKRDDKFLIVETDGEPVEEFDTQEEAIAFVRESMREDEQKPVEDSESDVEEEVEDDEEEVEEAMQGDDEKALDSEPDVAVIEQRSLDDADDRTRVRSSLVEALLVQRGTFKALGNRVFVAAPTNAFVDRENEIISVAALERYAARAMRGIVPKPELWHYHLRGTKHGRVEWVGVVDRTLVAIGRFDDTPAGRSAEKYYESAAAGEVTMSHGFMYRPRDFDGRVYRDVNIFEISTLPAGKEANPFTTFSAVKEKNTMPITTEQKQQIERVFGASAGAILSRVDELNKVDKALADLGVEYKEFAADVTDSAVEAEQNKAAQQIDGDELAAIKSIVTQQNEDLGSFATDTLRLIKGMGSLAERVKRIEALLELSAGDVTSSSKTQTEGDGTDSVTAESAALDELAEKQRALEKSDSWGTMFPGMYPKTS